MIRLIDVFSLRTERTEMKTFLRVMVFLCLASSALADTRPILLVTPKGVYQAEVVDGVPGPWRATDFDVIVQGFSVGGPPAGPVPIPPKDPPVNSDPLVVQISAFSKATLKDKNEGIAISSLIAALQKANVTPESFKESFDMAITIADSSMKSEGRLIAWKTGAFKISDDPEKLKAGLQAAFGVASVTLDQITSAAFADDEAALPEEVKDFTQIIQMIQMILDLLRNLGII